MKSKRYSSEELRDADHLAKSKAGIRSGKQGELSSLPLREKRKLNNERLRLMKSEDKRWRTDEV